ncbi:hypothetical protein PDE_01123 [Penicillium oxalicum 114-2]|uniref:Uncharacterized protein n=1 Tax=Penicillium oxalicum (strain 114-2 / CGMCC 5302) TaxID=933388 RepID=S8AWD5_PENO1|nr:hypothetical protein PDE_01123 [Penicillium oxalicum 114-2]
MTLSSEWKISIEVFQISDSDNKRNQPATSALYSSGNHASIRSPSEAVNPGSKNSQGPPLSSYRDTQNLVTQSYIQAQSSNTVSFTQIPQEVTVNSLGLPIARDWTQFAEKHNLDTQSIDRLIVDAFCSNAGTIPNPVKTTTTELECGILLRSQYL